MSHKVTVDVQFLDIAVLGDVLKELGIEHQIAQTGSVVTTELYQGEESGVCHFKLPRWNYPIVVKEDGSAVLDNFNGRWGNLEDLNPVKQQYSMARNIKTAKAEGMRIKSRETLQDGTLRIRVGG